MGKNFFLKLKYCKSKYVYTYTYDTLMVIQEKSEYAQHFESFKCELLFLRNVFERLISGLHAAEKILS